MSGVEGGGSALPSARQADWQAGWLGLIVLMAFAVFRMPPWLTLFAVEANGVDPSWQMLLNEAIPQGWMFDRDLFFTYGPFGFVHARMYHPETWSLLIVACVGISVVIADLVWRVIRHARLSPIWKTLCAIALIEIISRDAMAICFTLHGLIYLEAIHSRDIDQSVSPGSVDWLGTLGHRVRQAVPILLLAALPWARFSYFVTASFLGGTLVVAAVFQRKFLWRVVLLLARLPGR